MRHESLRVEVPERSHGLQPFVCRRPERPRALRRLLRPLSVAAERASNLFGGDLRDRVRRGLRTMWEFLHQDRHGSGELRHLRNPMHRARTRQRHVHRRSVRVHVRRRFREVRTTMRRRGLRPCKLRRVRPRVRGEPSLLRRQLRHVVRRAGHQLRRPMRRSRDRPRELLGLRRRVREPRERNRLVHEFRLRIRLCKWVFGVWQRMPEHVRRHFELRRLRSCVPRTGEWLSDVLRRHVRDCV